MSTLLDIGTAAIVERYDSQQSNNTYLTISDGRQLIKVSGDRTNGLAPVLDVPMLEKFRLQAIIGVRQYTVVDQDGKSQDRQVLIIESARVSEAEPA